MKSTAVYDAYATIREYKDPATGKKKKHRQRIGIVFQNNEHLSLKLECLPVTNDWSGWVSLLPREPRAESVSTPPGDASEQRPSCPAPPAENGAPNASSVSEG